MQGVIGTRFPHVPATVAPRGTTPRWPVAMRRLGDAIVIVVAVLFYFAVRGLVHGREVAAIGNARSLIRFEGALGIFWEPSIQRWALDHGPIGTVANWVYIWGHWPVITATLIWLVVRHHDAFITYRNALLLSGAIGLVIFSLFPMAPPRFMVDWGFVDTVTLHSNAYRVLQPPIPEIGR